MNRLGLGTGYSTATTVVLSRPYMLGGWGFCPFTLSVKTCVTDRTFSIECHKTKKKVITLPITTDADNPTNQSQQTQTIQQTNHNRRRQSNKPITTDADNPTNQSQQTQTIQQTNHNRRRQSNKPITTDADNPTNQSQQDADKSNKPITT